MDTQLLAAFIAVAGAASFSQAAEQLHLTQPAISKRIAQLEQLLGARLFDRIGRGLHDPGRQLRRVEDRAGLVAVVPLVAHVQRLGQHPKVRLRASKRVKSGPIRCR